MSKKNFRPDPTMDAKLNSKIEITFLYIYLFTTIKAQNKKLGTLYRILFLSPGILSYGRLVSFLIVS
jgi:hypothetical protein